jgi:GntR family transcriptional repressor for pyruvate dehydrogenase complex
LENRDASLTLKSLQKTDVREQVFEQMLNQIIKGVWKAGDKLPSENELTKILGVSRISVREAVQKLVAIDLVETHRGKGSFVKEFTTNNYLRSLTPMLLMTKKDILYVTEYRRILELGIIDLYVERATSADINILKNYLKSMKTYRDNLKEYTHYDLDFHLKLYEMTQNPFIIKISNMIGDILSNAMKSAVTPQGAEEGIVYHTKILKAIEARDSEKLKGIVNDLFDQIEKEIKESITDARDPQNVVSDTKEG